MDPSVSFFHPTIPPSSTSKKDRMDFVFPSCNHEGQTAPRPTPSTTRSSKLQPQRWRGCRVINISDASWHLLWCAVVVNVELFPPTSQSPPSVTREITSVLLHLRADAGWCINFSWGGDRWAASTPTPEYSALYWCLNTNCTWAILSLNEKSKMTGRLGRFRISESYLYHISCKKVWPFDNIQERGFSLQKDSCLSVILWPIPPENVMWYAIK